MNTDQHRSIQWYYLCLSVFICGSFLFFYRLSDRDLWSSHEARAAQNAQSILDSGDWLQSRLFDGTPEMQKPPLYYWLVAGSAWIRGGNVAALDVRLPAALSAIGTILLILFSFRARPVAAVCSALVLATAQHFTWIGRTGRIDVPLTFTTTAAVLALRSNGRCAHLGGYVAIAAGVLLKGPIGAVLPGIILSTSRVLRARNEETKGTWRWGIPLVLALTVSWFVAIHVRTDGEFTRSFFWFHHLQRASGNAETLAAHPWWTYLARLIVDALPWSPLFLIAAYFSVRSRWLREDRLARFGFGWLIAVTLLLSLSQFKRADYLLPAYPGLAIFLGCFLDRVFSFRARWIVPSVCTTCGTAVVAWFLALNTIVPQLDAERTKSSFAAEIRRRVPQPRQVLLFRVEDHLLAFHLGSPQSSFLEWENLDIWVSRPVASHVVMSRESVAEWRQYITSGTLEVVCRYSDETDRRRPRDLVLVRTKSHETVAAGTRSSANPPAADVARTDQRTAAVPQPIGRIVRDR